MYVFSTFVMRGLDRTGPVEAITAMRGINAEANSNPVFLLGYFGATILALVVGVIAVMQLQQPGSWWVLVGAVFAILAAVITMVFNVPLNNHLDTVNPDRTVGGRRGPRVAGVLLDLDCVEPRAHGHQLRRSRAAAGRPALPLNALARRSEPAGVGRRAAMPAASAAGTRAAPATAATVAEDQPAAAGAAAPVPDGAARPAPRPAPVAAAVPGGGGGDICATTSPVIR